MTRRLFGVNASWVLLLILIFAAAVRLYGIDFALDFRSVFYRPSFIRPDEEMLWISAGRALTGYFQPGNYLYPSLFKYAIAAVYGIWGIFKLVFQCGGSAECVMRKFVMNPSELILAGRLLTAGLGMASVYLTYRIAKRIWDEPSALFSAFFLAANYLHVRNSHFSTTDVPVTFMILLAFMKILDLVDKASLKNYLACGLWIGLAVSTKYPAFLLLVPMTYTHFSSGAPRPPVHFLSAGFGFALIGFIMGTPYVVLDYAGFSAHWQSDFGSYSPPHWDISFLFEYLREYREWFFWANRFSMGLPMLIAAFLGTLFVFRYGSRQTSVILIFIFGLIFFVGYGKYRFMRYVVPLMPFACLLAARITAWFWGRFLKCKAAAVILAVLLSGPSLVHVWEFDLFLGKKDSRVIAAEWIRKHVSLDSRILVAGSFYTDPQGLFKIGPQQMQDVMLKRIEWPPPYLLRYLELPPLYERDRLSIRELETDSYSTGGFDYLIVPSSPIEEFTISAAVIEKLKKKYPLVFYVDGVGHREEMNFENQDAFFIPVDGIRFIQRPGPDIYVFKLPKDQAK